jgi:hypothetical protein
VVPRDKVKAAVPYRGKAPRRLPSSSRGALERFGKAQALAAVHVSQGCYRLRGDAADRESTGRHGHSGQRTRPRQRLSVESVRSPVSRGTCEREPMWSDAAIELGNRWGDVGKGALGSLRRGLDRTSSPPGSLSPIVHMHVA